MSRVIPSRRTLLHLSRICELNLLSKPATQQKTSSYACTYKTSSSLQLPPRTQASKHLLRNFTSTSILQQNTTLPNQTSDPTADPQILASPNLPDITSYYTLFPKTIPKGAPPKGQFKIANRALRKEFLSLQSQHHPDKYTSSPVAHQKSLALSALINSAYKTLSDPLLRAQYLLAQNYGIDVTSEDNSSHRTDQATLMEVMEVQETFEEAREQNEIDVLKDENRRRIRDTEEKMGKAFERDDADAAKEECVRLNFWRSLQSGLDDWEPGKEVRLIH